MKKSGCPHIGTQTVAGAITVAAVAVSLVVILFFAPEEARVGKAVEGEGCTLHSDCDSGSYCDSVALICKEVPFAASRSIAGCNVSIAVDPTGGEGVFTVQETVAGGIVNDQGLDISCGINAEGMVITCDYDTNAFGAVSYAVKTDVDGGIVTITGIVVGTVRGQSVSKVISGEGSTASDTFCLRELCTDGADNDEDGAVDCKDSECSLHAGCTPSGASSSSADEGGFRCIPQWDCADTWGVCNATREQSRTCRDMKRCEQNRLTMKEVRSCSCEESWVCTQWEECTNGKQFRDCFDEHQCSTDALKPVLEKGCDEPEPPAPVPARVELPAVQRQPASPSEQWKIYWWLLLAVAVGAAAAGLIYHLHLAKKGIRGRKRAANR